METNTNKRVFGVYNNEADAQRAIEELLNMGYTSEQISVLSRSGDNVEVDGAGTATEAGLKGGAATGATIGGLGGLLAGLGLLAIPGIGPILAAGPIAAAIAGAVTGGAIGGTIGTLGGVMMDAGVDEADARYADERFQAGDIIVYVDTDVDRFDQVSETLGYRTWDPEYKPGNDTSNNVENERGYKPGNDPGYNPDARMINTVYQGDSDLHHDNLDLNEPDRMQNRAEDKVTDSRHDAQKNAEKLDRRFDNAGEPLENAQNWTGDKVSDVEHEGGKLFDKADNRTVPVSNDGYNVDSDLRHDNLDLDTVDETNRTYDTRNNGFREEGVRDEFDRTGNRVEDAVTDTKHDVQKNSEKLERRVDNAGEPLEDAQNWAGDKVTDVKHEAAKLIDKAKNRTDE